MPQLSAYWGCRIVLRLQCAFNSNLITRACPPDLWDNRARLIKLIEHAEGYQVGGRDGRVYVFLFVGCIFSGTAKAPHRFAFA